MKNSLAIKNSDSCVTDLVLLQVVEWKHGWRALNGMNVMLVGTSILSPLLAAGSVLGVMSALAIPMTSMMCLMPFLLLGIGVDDAFLMIHSWRKLRDNRRELTRAEHLSLTLADVGPSITITSLTNTLAFCIGSFSPMPQIRSFCICTALALLADFVLEIAFFGAVVVVSSSEEYQPAPVDEKPKKKPDASLAVSINAIREEVLRLYIKVITSWPARITAAAFLIVLWTISAMGVAKLQSAFWPGKTFQARSRLVSSMAIVDRMYYDHEITLILVNRPPQVDNNTEYQHFMSSIKQFQSMSNACGPNMTSLWLTDYAAFDNEAHDTAALFGMDSDHHLTYANVPEFLKSYAQYQGVVHWSHDSRKEVRVDGFAMWLCTTRMRSWYDRAQTLMEYRKIIDQYPTFNMTTFLFDASIFDLILSTGDVTIMAVIVTLISMAIVCLLFIPSLGCVLIATVTIGSIILAVVGSLSWWDCDMDVIAMVDILMAIGFTIDFTAHIIFHYCKSGANIKSHSSSTTLKQPSSDVPKEERLYVTLSAISYPMFQAGFSTWLIVAPFFLYDVYMYRTFVKTITLTVGFGMIHGLILLPIALACLPNRFTSARVNSNSAPNLKPEVTFEELQSLAADT
uniref:SSD domain-containing protein n=1 Tax=Plectus sambesii TaxID=2011161 RepID=A0A914VWV2_9BILA